MTCVVMCFNELAPPLEGPRGACIPKHINRNRQELFGLEWLPPVNRLKAYAIRNLMGGRRHGVPQPIRMNNLSSLGCNGTGKKGKHRRSSPDGEARDAHGVGDGQASLPTCRSSLAQSNHIPVSAQPFGASGLHRRYMPRHRRYPSPSSLNPQ